MSNELKKGWAKDLSKETLQAIMKVGDGHTLLKPDGLIEEGIPKHVVEAFAKIHYSEKIPKWDVVKMSAQYLHEGLRSFDVDKDVVEDLVESLFRKLIDEGKEIAGYHPKYSIFVNGEIVDEMEAVYGLDLMRAVISDLGLKFDSKMGRGFQYSSYCKAVQGYIEQLDQKEV